MTIPVKVFQSTDSGAPTLNGQAGSVIAVLDACLINGYGLISPDSITRTGQLATATRAAGHPYKPGDAILNASWTQPEYNGEQIVTATTATTYSFAVTGTPATPATGAGTTKRAPSGWLKAFSGVNLAAYKSQGLGATGLLLRVDDTLANTAAIVGYETMSDVNTGTGLFPTALQLAGGLYIGKSSTADMTARGWILIADDRFFYLFTNPATSYPLLWGVTAFGDFVSEKSGDAYGCDIIGNTLASAASSTPWGSQDWGNLVGVNNAQVGHYLARAFNQIGGALQFGKMGDNAVSNTMGGGGMAYPSGVNNGLYVSPIAIGEATAGGVIRGKLPGVYQPLHNKPLGHGNTVTNLVGLPGKTLLAIGTALSSNPGETHIDITGPWR